LLAKGEKKKSESTKTNSHIEFYPEMGLNVGKCRPLKKIEDDFKKGTVKKNGSVRKVALLGTRASVKGGVKKISNRRDS